MSPQLKLAIQFYRPLVAATALLGSWPIVWEQLLREVKMTLREENTTVKVSTEKEKKEVEGNNKPYRRVN